VFDVIAKEGVTVTALVPALALRWIESPDRERFDLSSLKVVQVGGARLAPEAGWKIEPVLGARLQQAFGMAEGLLNFTRLDDPDAAVVETQGRPMCPDDEIRIVGPDGEEVAPGEDGELLTRGPYTLRGYYRAPEHNARAFTDDGFYRSGDVVRQDADGNLLVQGRVKDLINRGGEKVSAEEIENLVLGMPEVFEVAAVAMPDRELGERTCVYVVPHAGRTVTLEQVCAHLTARQIARFKLPERLEVVDVLPVTKVGKIDKKALRDDVRGRLEREGVDLSWAT
jgi:2,3-dihydroxybenzoate-AMP ligase